MFINVGSEKMTQEDVSEIMQGRCINCYGPYNELKRTVFVRLVKSGRLLWWHAEH